MIGYLIAFDASTLALGAAIFTGGLTVFLLMLLLIALAIGEPISISSRWGGLGGGLGGWTISRPLVYLAGVLFFGGVTAVVAVQYLQSQQAAAQQQSRDQFELQKAKEADERRYQDADKARTEDLEKARLTAKPPQK